MKSVRFLHTADLHLGSPLKSIGSASPAIHKQLQDTTIQSLLRIVDAALRYQVDFVAFSGDVFDADSRSIRGNQQLIEQLDRLHHNDIPAFLIGGNHDPISAAYRESLTLPPNTVVFPSDTVTSETVYRKKEAVARVLGQSYRGKSDSRKMYDGYTVQDDALWNIALLHSALDSNSRKYVPCTVDNLQSKQNIHYWAMGHLHSRRIISDEYPVIAYPGIPQGRDIGEPGVGSCLLVELVQDSSPNITPLPTASVVWLNEIFSLQENTEHPPGTLDELAESLESFAEVRVNNFLETARDDFPAEEPLEIEGAIIRWHIVGKGEIHEILSEDREEASQYLTDHLRKRLVDNFPFIWTESVRIRTTPLIPSLDELAEKNNTFRDLLHITHELRENPDELGITEAVGKIWEANGDPEAMDPDKFLLNSTVLPELFDEATQRVVEAILKQREQS